MTNENSATTPDPLDPQDGGVDRELRDAVDNDLSQAEHLLRLAEWVERARLYIDRIRIHEQCSNGFAEELRRHRLTTLEISWDMDESEALQALNYSAQNLIADANKRVQSAMGVGQ